MVSRREVLPPDGKIAVHNYTEIMQKGEPDMEIRIKDEFIKLGQALKLANVVSDGVEAKIVMQDGRVKVNGEVDERRGRKVYPGDVIDFNGEEIRVIG